MDPSAKLPVGVQGLDRVEDNLHLAAGFQED